MTFKTVYNASVSEEPSNQRRCRRSFPWRAVFAVVTGLGFVATGLNHFLNPDLYIKIIPPVFPDAPLLVIISGVAEIAGGMGLLIRPLRRAAGWGLIALLIAVFPANVYMAVVPGLVPNLHIPVWLLWLRLPLQGVFIVWVWFVAIRRPARF